MVSSAGLTSESLPQIDMSKLSQSELHSLSLCSKSTFKPDNDNDPITPHLNPSTFNKSDSTRRQTYSRPFRRRRLSQKSPNFPVAAASASVPPRFSRSDSIEAENKSILGHLKKHLGEKEEFSNSSAMVVGNPEAVIETKSEAMEPSHSNERKTKKRKRVGEDKLDNLKDGNGVRAAIELSKVNSKGVIVDFQELGNCDGYFVEELKKRTEGLGTEEEGLGFLRGLDGEWCSRRKKRKFVDASEFGDKFPVSWKLLLGLRRKDGIFSVYCRRFVSPAGEYFVSCKEASLYLQSYFGDRENQEINQRTGTFQQVGIGNTGGSGTHAGVIAKENAMHVDKLPILSTNDKEQKLLRTDTLYEVEVSEIFDCSKCKLTFEQKKDFVKHVLKVHQKTTRRYELDKSAGGGVIFNDDEKKKQTDTAELELGVHSKNNVKSSKELPVQVTNRKCSEPPSHDEPSRTYRMDASVESAHNLALKNAKDGCGGELRSAPSPNNMNMEISATNPDHEQCMEHLNKMGKDVMVSKKGGVFLVTTVCVWCAKKFTRGAFNSENLSDSVGFMCPTCKATISKSIDSGFNHF